MVILLHGRYFELAIDCCDKAIPALSHDRMRRLSQVLYLHGFASGPSSTKANFFSSRFAEVGVEATIPDLNEDDFEGLNITRELELIHGVSREIKPSVVMGSSHGGYLAALHACQHPELAPALVLMAPGFGFPGRWDDKLGSKRLAEWKHTGSMPFFHYGAHCFKQVGYQFYEDAQQYDPFPPVKQPTLIFHGKGDEAVDAELSKEFAAGKPNVELHLLDSDHGLTDVMDEMWAVTARFCEGLETVSGGKA